jgi:hypothetical protein
MFNIEQITANIIAEYQTIGKAEISMNLEGPCNTAIGLYRLLDYICHKFDFEKNNISIMTTNLNENHDEYKIIHQKQPWIKCTRESMVNMGLNVESFRNKDVTHNLFGCLFNIPSWPRLCILSYLTFNTKNQSKLHCNPTFDERKYNTVSFTRLIEDAPVFELYNVIEYLKTEPTPALNDMGDDKPISSYEVNQPLRLYHEFFIDIIAETYTSGNTFFLTEKTIRPILALTPFIIYGSCGFLRNLKDRYGFKTFDNWWDESYDNYESYERIQRMYQIFDFLDSLSDNEKVNMYNDMQDVLQYNYDVLMKI